MHAETSCAPDTAATDTYSHVVPHTYEQHQGRWSDTSDVDPEKQRDRLPQPYRMIWKVLEMEILDRAWLEITRHHPELLQAADGKQLIHKANQSLQILCTPSSVVEPRGGLPTSLIHSGDKIFMTTAEDALVMCNLDGKLECSCYVSSSIGIAVEASEPPDHSESSASSMNVSSLWIGAATVPLTDERIVRIAVCRVVLVEEEVVEPEPAAGKKAPPKKGASEPPPRIKVAKCRVVIFEARIGDARSGASSLSRLRPTHIFYVNLELPTKVDVKSVDISLDGELVSVTTASKCSLFTLPKVKTANERRTMADITEDLDEIGFGDHPVSAQSEAVSAVESYCSFGGLLLGDSGPMQRVTVVPLHPHSAYSKQANATITDRGCRIGLVVIFENSPEFILLGLLQMTGSSGLSELEAAQKAIIVLCKWQLTASISCTTMDAGRSTLILGARDGSVSVWNICSRSLADTVCKHEEAITALDFFQGGSGNHTSNSESNYYLVCGAADGTLSFFHVLLPQSTSIHGASRAAFVDRASPKGTSVVSLTTVFLAFRNDFDVSNAVIRVRSMPQVTLVCVTYACGSSVTYEAQTGQLLGKLVLYSGIMARKVNWEVCTNKCISHILERMETLQGGSSTDKDAQETKSSSEKENFHSEIKTRALKYADSSFASWNMQDSLNNLATFTQNAYHCMYLSDGSPVLATFSFPRIVACHLPGLSSLLDSRAVDSSNLLQIFNLLSPSERMHRDLAMARASSTESFGSAATGTADRSRTRGSVSDTKFSRANPPLSAPKGGIRKPSKGKLGALGYDGLASSSDAFPGGTVNSTSAKFDSISRASWDRIIEPSGSAMNSAFMSHTQRLQRKNKLTGVLKSLSEAL